MTWTTKRDKEPIGAPYMTKERQAGGRSGRPTSGRRSGTTPRKPKSRRKRILAAAADLIANRGYAATGIDEIGAAAGITGGGVYRHFESKLDLFRAVMEPMAQRRINRMAEISAEPGPPRKRLRLLVDNMIDAILEDRSISAALWRELRHLSLEGVTWFDRVHALNVREFMAVLKDIRPDLSGAEAEARIQAFFGLAFSAAEFEKPLPREELKQLLDGAALDVLLC